MKQRIRSLILLMLLLTIWGPATISAQSNPGLYLATDTLNLAIGQEVIVEMAVEHAPPIYGLESHLSFDPTRLEVVEIKHGSFFSPDPDNEMFILQNQADNDQGTIDYALALLNPAPPVDGDGIIAHITLRAKTDGPAIVQITEALLGTQTGDELTPMLENAQLTITAERQPSTADGVERQSAQPSAAPARSQAEEQPVIETAPIKTASAQSHPTSNDAKDNRPAWLGLSILGAGLLVISLVGFIGVIGLVGGWLFFVRSQRK